MPRVSLGFPIYSTKSVDNYHRGHHSFFRNHLHDLFFYDQLHGICFSLRPERRPTSPQSLEDLYKMKSRPEGHICEMRYPPKYKTVHGFIEVHSIKERIFFNEYLSGIPKSETFNFHLNAKVQFSVDKNEKGFFAKKIYIQVRIKSFKHVILS